MQTIILSLFDKFILSILLKSFKTVMEIKFHFFYSKIHQTCQGDYKLI
jgi:hypothetical protein